MGPAVNAFSISRITNRMFYRSKALHHLKLSFQGNFCRFRCHVIPWCLLLVSRVQAAAGEGVAGSTVKVCPRCPVDCDSLHIVPVLLAPLKTHHLDLMI